MEERFLVTADSVNMQPKEVVGKENAVNTAKQLAKMHKGREVSIWKIYMNILCEDKFVEHECE